MTLAVCQKMKIKHKIYAWQNFRQYNSVNPADNSKDFGSEDKYMETSLLVPYKSSTSCMIHSKLKDIEKTLYKILFTFNQVKIR